MLRITLSLIAVALLGITTTHAQSMDKKYKTMKVERVIKAPAEKVWKAMVLDYGDVANYSPSIYSSEYESGSLKGVVGAERKCYFNENGTKWAHETIKEIDNQNMTMKNIVLDAAKFPLDKDNSYAVYSVKDNGDGTTTAAFEFNYRTKPAFMSAIAKGSFNKLLTETLMGLDHYLTTGEKVNGNSGNWAAIKKNYK